MSFLNIPMPFHICVDDTGWFCGSDDRKIGGPSRTGMKRFHTVEDYIAIENLGKAINMKISCGFVLGEWDMEGNIKKLPNSPRFGKTWQLPENRNKKEMEKIADVINSSSHIDFVLHGIYHGYYKDGADTHDISDYYYPLSGKIIRIPENEIRQKFDSFFRIMDYHKIKKQVNQFIPPSFVFRQGDLTEILKSYGIYYCSTIFKTMTEPSDDVCDFVFSENGVTIVDRNNNLPPWNETATDFSLLPECNGIFGIHWPNFLHEDPLQNDAVVANAAEYINRCCSRFDTVAAEDISVCAMQLLVNKYGKICENDKGITIDLTAIPNTPHSAFFLVNSKKPLKTVEGGIFEEYKKHTGHTTYKITPSVDTVKIVHR